MVAPTVPATSSPGPPARVHEAGAAARPPNVGHVLAAALVRGPPTSRQASAPALAAHPVSPTVPRAAGGRGEGRDRDEETTSVTWPDPRDRPGQRGRRRPPTRSTCSTRASGRWRTSRLPAGGGSARPPAAAPKRLARARVDGGAPARVVRRIAWAGDRHKGTAGSRLGGCGPGHERPRCMPTADAFASRSAGAASSTRYARASSPPARSGLDVESVT